MKTKSLVLLFALICALAVSACGTSATATPTPTATSSGATPTSTTTSGAWDAIVAKAKQEGTVVVYGTGSLRGSEGQQIAQMFKDKYGITVENIAGAGSPTMQRVQTEIGANQASADAVFLSPPWPGTFQNAGLYQSLKDEPLPVFSENSSVWKLDPTAMSKDLLFVPVRPSYPSAHVMVNTTLLAQADYPTSFADLATNPKFKGKIMWVDPQTTQDLAFKYTLWGYVGKALTLDDMWKIYTNQNVFLVADPGKEPDALAQGQAAIAVGVAGFESVVSEGAPIQAVRFAGEPVVSNVDTIGMVTKATHPNAAMVFINWLLSADGQQALVDVGHYRTLRAGMSDGLPSSLANPVLTGSGSAGPEYVVTAEQAQLPGFIHKNANDAWVGLLNGISESDFTTAVQNQVTAWEADNGNQSQGLALK